MQGGTVQVFVRAKICPDPCKRGLSSTWLREKRKKKPQQFKTSRCTYLTPTFSSSYSSPLFQFAQNLIKEKQEILVPWMHEDFLAVVLTGKPKILDCCFTAWLAGLKLSRSKRGLFKLGKNYWLSPQVGSMLVLFSKLYILFQIYPFTIPRRSTKKTTWTQRQWK